MTDPLTPVLTAHWDQPDIFTLDGYRRAGGWQALPKALGMTPRRGHRDREELRAARPRRGRLPDRREVGLPAAGRQQAALPGGQRGRIRAWRLQGRPADDGHPAHAHRGRGHRLVRDQGQPRVHLRPGRGAARDPPAAARGAGGVRGRLPRPEHPRLRVRPGRHRARRSRRLHLRRGDRAAGLAGGAPRTTAEQAAVPGRGRRVRPPDEREQRGVDRQRAGRSC